jgi:hypothetical protein
MQFAGAIYLYSGVTSDEDVLTMTFLMDKKPAVLPMLSINHYL